LVRRLKADPQKIKVIYEGVDREKFQILSSKSQTNSKSQIQKIKRKYEIKGDYVLFVGTIQPRKNLERLIEAFARILGYKDTRILGKRQRTRNILVSQYPHLSLVLAGKLGWMYDKILQAPKKFGVGDKVQFLGHVPDKELPILYQGARVFCLPSLCEGFGLPVLEAMAAGTPVVAARAGALPEVVGGAGLLVNPKRIKEIAQALKLIIENQALSEGLREKGLRRVRDFSWQGVAMQTLAAFNFT